MMIEGIKGMERKRVDLDTILQEELGQFGTYQAKTMALAGLLVIFFAFTGSEYIFTTARINTSTMDKLLATYSVPVHKRCRIAECEFSVDQPQFSTPWLENALPSSGGGFDNCHRYDNATTITKDTTANNDTVDTISKDVDISCPASLFDSSTTIACDQYVFENTNTVVYDFGLACNEWRRSLIGSARKLGMLVTLSVAGLVSDRWGRRTVLVVSAFNSAWIGLTRYFADSYYAFIVSEFVESVFGSATYSSAYILVMELVGPKYRVMAGTFMNTCLAAGHVLMGLVAWRVPNWRLLTIALYAPQLITIFYFWLVPESVRWYMSKGHYEQAEDVLKNIARVNNKQLSEKSLQALRQTAIEEQKKRELEKQNKKNEPWLIVLVFKHKPILVRCLTAPVWWITMAFIYQGLSVNSVNMSGNRYLNYVTVSAVDIPGFWLSYLLLNRIGRKPVLSGAFFVCAAFQIGYILLPEGQEAVALSLYLVCKFSIAMVMTALYVYTAELFPTKYRHSLFAFSSMVGRVGAVLAPLTPALGAAVWPGLPFALFGSFALVSALLVLVTPETLGTQLPDTMEEAAGIGRKVRV